MPPVRQLAMSNAITSPTSNALNPDKKELATSLQEKLLDPDTAQADSVAITAGNDQNQNQGVNAGSMNLKAVSGGLASYFRSTSTTLNTGRKQSKPKGPNPLLPQYILDSAAYYQVLGVIIFVNIFAYFARTEPDLDEGWVIYIETLQFLTCVWFAIEYGLRCYFYSRNKKGTIVGGHEMPYGLTKFIFSFYSFVDLASFLPYFLHLIGIFAILGLDSDYITTTWIRMLRLFVPLQRCYLEGFSFFGKVFIEKWPLLQTSGFCGITVWIICSALYYKFERDNPLQIYCPAGDPNDLNPSDFQSHQAYLNAYNQSIKLQSLYPCYNRFQSIPSSMYMSLVNFFGEYPLIDNYSIGGRVVGVFIQIVGAAVLAIPAGVMGSAFQDVVSERCEIDEVGGEGGEGEEEGGEEQQQEGEIEIQKSVKLSKESGDATKSQSMSPQDGPGVKSIITIPIPGFNKAANLENSNTVQTPAQTQTQNTDINKNFKKRRESLASKERREADEAREKKRKKQDEAAAAKAKAEAEEAAQKQKLALSSRNQGPNGNLSGQQYGNQQQYQDSNTIIDLHNQTHSQQITQFSKNFFFRTTGPGGSPNTIGGQGNIVGVVKKRELSTTESLAHENFEKEEMKKLEQKRNAHLKKKADLEAAKNKEKQIQLEIQQQKEKEEKERLRQEKKKKVDWREVINGDDDTDAIVFGYKVGLSRGALWKQITTYLVLGSVANVILSTVTFIAMAESGQQFLPPLWEVILMLFNFANHLTVLSFFLEWAYRLYHGNFYYIFSIYGFVDFCAWFPTLMFFLTGGLVWHALGVLRIFKLERFIKAFTAFDDILQKNAAVFMVTGYVALVFWIFFSIAMHHAEKDNPDPKMNRYYYSASASLWLTLLNLSGESPLCDYTILGRWFTGFMGLVAVAFVTIPMGVLGAGFEDWLGGDDDDDDDEEEEEEEKGEDEGEDEDKDGNSTKDKEGNNNSDEKNEKTEKPEKPQKMSEEEKRMKLEDITPLSMQKVNRLALAREREEGVIKELNLREKVYQFLLGASARDASINACRFEKLIFFLIFLTSTIAMLETVQGFADDGTWLNSIFDGCELIGVLIFTLEYLLRYYSAPEDPYYASNGYTSPNAARLAYSTGLLSIIDLLAIIPYYMAIGGSSIADKYDGELRMLRVLRLLTLDKYVPSVSLIGRVFSKNMTTLKYAMYAAGCFWVFFAAMLYVTERGDSFITKELSMGDRYRSILSAMPYTLVHLTGDYPLIDYRFDSKLLLGVSLVIAVGIVAVPAGILASGFSDELQIVREQQRHEKEKSLQVLRYYARRWLKKHRMQLRKKDSIVSERRRQKEEIWKSYQNKPIMKCRNFLDGLTVYGSYYKMFIAVLIITNVLAVLLESMPDVQKALGQTVFDRFELISVLIFTTEYLARIWTAKVNKEYRCDRYAYITSFLGTIDFITVAPYWIEVILDTFFSITFDSFFFRLFRIVRILQLEKFVGAFGLLGDVFSKAKDSLISTLFLALLVWVMGSCLFYEFEKDNPLHEGAFSSLPSSMYYCAIFLGGEWGVIDFTPAGSCVCIWYAAGGIAVFSLPVGSLFEAFGDVLSDQAEQAEGEKSGGSGGGEEGDSGE